MNSQEFSIAALATEKVPQTLRFSRSGLAMLLASCIGMAKIADQVKKTMIYDKAFDTDEFTESLYKLESQLQTMRMRAHSIATPEDTESPLHAPNLRLTHGAIGMFGETGEILEALLKHLQTGELDLVNVAEETGDSDWYKNLIHDETGISEEVSRHAVIEKLTNKKNGRYKNGFSEEAALNRDTDAERALLEAAQAA